MRYHVVYHIVVRHSESICYFNQSKIIHHPMITKNVNHTTTEAAAEEEGIMMNIQTNATSTYHRAQLRRVIADILPVLTPLPIPQKFSNVVK